MPIRKLKAVVEGEHGPVEVVVNLSDNKLQIRQFDGKDWVFVEVTLDSASLIAESIKTLSGLAR